MMATILAILFVFTCLIFFNIAIVAIINSCRKYSDPLPEPQGINQPAQKFNSISLHRKNTKSNLVIKTPFPMEHHEVIHWIVQHYPNWNIRHMSHNIPNFSKS